MIEYESNLKLPSNRTSHKNKKYFFLQYKCKFHSTMRYFPILFYMIFEANIVKTSSLMIKGEEDQKYNQNQIITGYTMKKCVSIFTFVP